MLLSKRDNLSTIASGAIVLKETDSKRRTTVSNATLFNTVLKSGSLKTQMDSRTI